jgi:hypothetical protein
VIKRLEDNEKVMRTVQSQLVKSKLEREASLRRESAKERIQENQVRRFEQAQREI